MLVVPRRIDAKVSRGPRLHVCDGNEVDTRGLRAVNGEEIDLPLIRAPGSGGVAMVAITAADGEDDRTEPQTTRLALHARETAHRLEDQIAARILAERQVDAVSELP